MGKSDLSSLKIKTEKKLPSVNTTSLLEPKKKIGRPVKAAEECESEPLTPIEMAILKKKAGLVPVSRYLKHYLRTETSFLND